jgi:hypothetical protein
MADAAPPPQTPEEEVAGLSVRDLLEILGLHAPVQRGTIQGRVQRRLDALPMSRVHDRELLRAIERRLLDYMTTHHLGAILLNEESEDYTAIQDTEGQVSQNPTRFYGAPSYPQQIVAGDLNPIRRRVMTRTLLVDSRFRQQHVAGDGILACSETGCTSNIDDCYSCAIPSNSVVSCFQAPSEGNCIPTGSNVLLGEGVTSCVGPQTNWALWHGEPNSRYIEAFRNQYLNCLPNAGEGVVLPCQLYEHPAGDFSFDLQRSTTKILSMTLTSIALPSTAVLTIPHPDPDEYLSGPGLHNLQCVYPTEDVLDSLSRHDPRATIWIVDESNNHKVYPLVVPAGHYADTFAVAQAITIAWQRLCDTTTDTDLAALRGCFRADGVRAAYVYDPDNQDIPFAISPAHTSGHIALSVPTQFDPNGGTDYVRLSIWFVPPPITPDGYLALQSRGTASEDCPSHDCFDNDVCPPTNVYSGPAQPWVTNAETNATEFHRQSFKGVPATGGQPAIPPVIKGQQPQVYKAMPGSLGWVLGYRVAQLSVADFASAPQPKSSFYPGVPTVFPDPGDDVIRSVLIGSSPYQASSPYLFLRINDHNNNYYAAVEGIAGESVMPPDTLAILQLQQSPRLGLAPSADTGQDGQLEQLNSGRYVLSPHVPYKREYFGPVDVARIRATLLDSNRNVCDLGQNNYSFTLTFETLYNL